VGTVTKTKIATTMTTEVTDTATDTATVMATAMAISGMTIMTATRSASGITPPGLAKRDRLPPGLERQLVVNGILPPGLQKKMQPCPPDLERVLPPPPPNYSHVVISGNLVLLNRANFQIVDVFHFEIP